MVVLSTCLEMHAMVLICCNTSGKCTKYETCAKLHRFHMLYNSCGFTPLIALMKYQNYVTWAYAAPLKFIFEPVHDISKNVVHVCATSKASDHLIRACVSRLSIL